MPLLSNIFISKRTLKKSKGFIPHNQSPSVLLPQAGFLAAVLASSKVKCLILSEPAQVPSSSSRPSSKTTNFMPGLRCLASALGMVRLCFKAGPCCGQRSHSLARLQPGLAKQAPFSVPCLPAAPKWVASAA